MAIFDAVRNADTNILPRGEEKCIHQPNGTLYEQQNVEEVRISQPLESTLPPFTLNDKVNEILNTMSKTEPPTKITLIRGENTRDIITKNSYTLHEIEQKYKDIEHQRSERVMKMHLPVTSVSLSALALLAIIVFVCLKLSTPLKNLMNCCNKQPVKPTDIQISPPLENISVTPPPIPQGRPPVRKLQNI